MTRVGEAIRAERKACGMTLADLAGKLGFSVAYLSELERTKLPSVDCLLNIANEFPDADTAAWLWLLLEDKWGQPIADLMRRHVALTAKGDGR